MTREKWPPSGHSREREFFDTDVPTDEPPIEEMEEMIESENEMEKRLNGDDLEENE